MNTAMYTAMERVAHLENVQRRSARTLFEGRSARTLFQKTVVGERAFLDVLQEHFKKKLLLENVRIWNKMAQCLPHNLPDHSG